MFRRTCTAKVNYSFHECSRKLTWTVTVWVHSSAKKAPVEIIVHELDSDTALVSHKSHSDQQFKFKVPSPKLWSPDSPTLYNLTVIMGDDEIQSYTGFRSIEKGTVNGIERPLLNGEFVFQFGPLDQGYWPDGLHTPPNREAMVYDLQVLKKLGFNMLRKHVRPPSTFRIALADW